MTELDRTPNDRLLHINNISLVKVTEVPQLLEKVFRGGVEDNIRPEVEKLFKKHSFHSLHYLFPEGVEVPARLLPMASTSRGMFLGKV